MEELTKQIDDFLKLKNNFENREKNYKSELKNKDKELLQLKAKIVFLNKKIKTLEAQINNNEIKQKSKSNSIANNSPSELPTNYEKLNNTLTQQQSKTIIIRNIKNCYFKNFSNLNNTKNNKNKNIIFFKNPKYNTKHLLLRNISASNIDINNKYNNNNKNNSINESMKNQIYKINESELNDISRYKSNKRITNSPSFINRNNNSQVKLKLINITNNNINMGKNNIMINLRTNIVEDNINKERIKVRQKLEEYGKLIDEKINKLKKNKARSFNNKKKLNQENDKMKISPNNKEICKKVSISCLNSDFSKKSKKMLYNISNTNYKFINNDYFKNMHDKKVILPKKISANEFKELINSNSQNYIINKPRYKKKLKIESKNIDEKSKFNINNFEDKNNIKIHEQKTSKGNDEERSEDSKK